MIKNKKDIKVRQKLTFFMILQHKTIKKNSHKEITYKCTQWLWLYYIMTQIVTLKINYKRKDYNKSI